MNLLIIAPEQIPVPPKAGGSVEHCIHQIASHFPQAHRITIASRSPQLPHKRRTPRQKDHQKHTAKPLSYIRVPRRVSLRYITSVLRRVKAKTYDLIQVDNRPANLPNVRAMFPNTPLSLFLHSLTYVTPVNEQTAHRLSTADLIIVNSYSLREELLRLYPNLRRQHIHPLHLGVNLEQFQPPSRRKQATLRAKNKLSTKFSIVYAGRIIPRKGIPILIYALQIARRIVPSAELLIAGKPGKPAYLAYLRKLAAALDVPIRLLGQVSRRNMHQVYWLGDCFVCPSQQYEAFGLVAAEAAACGIPVIASRNGGLAEIIAHNEDGLLIDDYTEPQAFAREIIRIASNPYLRKQLASQGRRKMEQHFSWDHTAGQLAKIYGEYIQQERRNEYAHF